MMLLWNDGENVNWTYKLNLLRHRWDRVIVSSSQAYPCSQIYRYGTALTWSSFVLFYRYHQLEKVMRVCCPDQVGGDNLVSPVVCLARESPFGTVLFGHDGGRCHKVTQGPPRTWPWEGMIVGGTVGESRVRQVSLEQHRSTRMGTCTKVRGQELHGVGKVRNLCRV